MNIVHGNINGALKTLIRNLVVNGTPAAPRGKPVQEILGNSISFDMRFPLTTLTARRLGYRFAPAEAAWILSGDNRLSTIKRYSRFIWEFSDDGFFYSGAYGPKIVDQLTYVCDCLADDLDTRQAIIDVWRPNPRPGRDIPCTLSFQFMIRDSSLHVVQNMRSSDAWLGYPYDAFNASMLAGYIILLLRDRKERKLSGLDLGSHTMLIGNSHLYQKDVSKASSLALCDEHVFEQPEFNPLAFDSPDSLLCHLWWLAGAEWDNAGSGYLGPELSKMGTTSSESGGRT